MKKIVFVFALFVTINMNAQTDKNARNIANEITKVLNLSEKDSEKVYALALEKVQKVKAFKKDNPAMNKNELKENLSTYNKTFSKGLRELVGNDNMKKLSDYRKQKRKTSKKKK